jgi:hypothetical protein
MKIARMALWTVAAVVGVGIAAPYVDAEGYRARIESALERALHREVTVQKVRFNLFTGPGFTIEGVTIAEDPSIGIEPFAYVDELKARVRLTSLWGRRISFSNLRFEGAPTLNLVKTDSGVWNYQLLLNRTSADDGDFPSIEVRGGRINFKFGDDKSVFYLSDADIDVDPADKNRTNLWFSGQPARTDRAARYFGRLLAKGSWIRPSGSEARLDITAELEPSAISEVARLFDSNSAVHGIIASRARIRGPISKLAVTGQLRFDDIHRWDMMPQRGGSWSVQYRGSLNLTAHLLDLSTLPTPDVPLVARFRASDYMSQPRWAASLELRGAPASAFVGLARHMGAPLPEGITLDGKLSGVVGYSSPGGAQGRFEFNDSAVQLPGAAPVRLRSGSVLIQGDRTEIGPAIVEMNGSQTAELSGAYDSGERTLQIRLETKGMDVIELHSGSGRLLGAGSVPVLEKCKQGIWRGWVRYTSEGDDPGAWSGDFNLQNARIDLPGIAEPLRIRSAAVLLDRSGRLSVRHMNARVGESSFGGEYRRIPGVAASERLKLHIGEIDIAEAERLLLPTLVRRRGLLARFRLGGAQPPAWLKSRDLEGEITVDKLTAGGRQWAVHSNLLWKGLTPRLTDIEAHNPYGAAEGDLTVNLTGDVPRYHLSGRIADLNYKGGAIVLEGSADTYGSGAALLANAHAVAAFTAENLVLSPDMDFRSITGTLELTPEVQLRFSSIQAARGNDVYSGQGSMQGDGRLTLELTTGRKQIRIAGNLLAPPETK